MSHYAKLNIQAQQQFEAHLVAALQEHFGQESVEVHEQKTDLLTYAKSKSGLKANIVVRQDAQGKKLGRFVAVNDLGYERNKTGTYDLHVDQDGFSPAAQNAVSQRYAELVATQQLKAKGFTVKSERTKAGEIRLVAQQYR